MKTGLGKFTKGLLVALVLPLVMMSGCKQEYSLVQEKAGQTGGNPPGGSGNPTPNPTCSQTIDTITSNVRILFMVDHSGSTFGSGGTDPTYQYRVNAIQTFLNQYGNKANFTYSFGYFGADKASLFDYGSNPTAYKLYQNPITRYFGTAAEMSNTTNNNGALQKYLAVAQDMNANTPYQKAFNAEKLVVTADTATNQSMFKYVMVFMSDGQPNPNISDSDLTTLIHDTQATATAAGSALSVSSVYFGPAGGTAAINKMKLIAQEGGGQFVDTNVNSSLNISDVIQVPGCH